LLPRTFKPAKANFNDTLGVCQDFAVRDIPQFMEGSLFMWNWQICKTAFLLAEHGIAGICEVLPRIGAEYWECPLRCFGPHLLSANARSQ